MKFQLFGWPLMAIFASSLPSWVQNELVDLSTFSKEFEYEIRYATEDNFIGEQLYDCSKCMLRPEVAKALLAANQYFCELGYKIKLYDCYRPLDVQKRMWEKVSRATYVANPNGYGSWHNKATAVDLTLVTLEGCFVDMGSDYDFFGPASHIDNFDLSSEIIENRKLLFETMRSFGFKSVRTEWWHYNFTKSYGAETLNIPLPCEK